MRILSNIFVDLLKLEDYEAGLNFSIPTSDVVDSHETMLNNFKSIRKKSKQKQLDYNITTTLKMFNSYLRQSLNNQMGDFIKDRIIVLLKMTDLSEKKKINAFII